jgi:hypothetical protein
MDNCYWLPLHAFDILRQWFRRVFQFNRFHMS